ncbi:MAG: nodulation protein NfeD [Candidatus Latescibacterota bacterium]
MRVLYPASQTFTALVIAILLLFPAGLSSAAAEGDSVSPPAASLKSAPGKPVVFISYMQGPIGPVSKDYFHRIVELAGADLPSCIVLVLDTPGGLDASMRSIIKDIFASPVPVVTFVYPSGARAASAGAIISLAAHITAMAPGTNMGAAHPVAIGQGQMDEEMAEKVTNDAAAYARSIATKRGRDLDWAEKVVRESISSTAQEAEELGIVDIVAADVVDLLKKLDGRTVEMNGRKLTLSTAEAKPQELRPSLRERFLARITDPNIAYLLMLLGFFGIIFELQNPGAIFPGVAGGISILLAFYALQLLPVNYAGLALIVLALILFALEIKIPSGGLLTVGGVIAMVIGSIMFIDSPLPFMRVSLSVMIPAVLFTVLFFLFAVGMGLRAQRRKVSTGVSGLIGEMGVAKSDVFTEGSVFVHGEYWNACSDEKIPAGSRIEVRAVDGMILKVKPSGKEV